VKYSNFCGYATARPDVMYSNQNYECEVRITNIFAQKNSVSVKWVVIIV